MINQQWDDIKMIGKNIAIIVVLVVIGVGMAFSFLSLMVSRIETAHKGVWMYQSSQEKPLGIPMLTEEQRQKTIEIAKQNETVKQYLEQGYEIAGVSPIGNISKEEEAMDVVSVDVTLVKDKEWVYTIVDLDKKEVVGIRKPHGEEGYLKAKKDKIVMVNETAIRILIGDREEKLIRAPEVRELTEEEREKAREIALSDTEVQNIVKGRNYELEIRPVGVIITNEAGEVETKFDGASIAFRLENGTVYFVHVELEKEKVIRISPPIYK